MSFPSKFFCFIHQLKSGAEAGFTNIAFILKNAPATVRWLEATGNFFW